jgi:IS1 family transposase
MIVWGIGIRDISTVLRISISKVFNVLKSSNYKIILPFPYYDYPKIDEFWTYVGKKKNKVWLIYAYHRESGGDRSVCYAWGKRDIKMAEKLRRRIKRLGISYDRITTDNWDSFLSVFEEDRHKVGKKYTVGIEGNNCRMRHKVRQGFRQTCCFSKKLFNHWKAFKMVFFTSTTVSFKTHHTLWITSLLFLYQKYLH